MTTKCVITEFYTREANAVHAALDDMDVPRENAGEKLSMSQRAALAAQAYARLTEQLWGP